MSNNLKIKKAEESMYDCVSLGEVMLRLDPGEGRIHTSRTFKVWEGGGEYNVTRALRRCFGMRTACVTALVDNSIGRLVEDCMLQGGVDTSLIHWVKEKDSLVPVRNGLNFTERGFGIRGAKGVPDRLCTAASQLKIGDIDWDDLFGKKGVRWFHTGGIFAALSSSTADLVIEAITAAHKYGTIVSYDLNYRPSLWNKQGGKEKAQKINLALAPMVDVLIGNEEDFTACLGLEVPGNEGNLKELSIDGYKEMINNLTKKFPSIKVVATTLRTVKNASKNDWEALCWENGELFKSRKWEDLDVLDRVGGGDSFASGLIYAFVEGKNAREAVEYGAAHGALCMTTPGDTSMSTLEEVEREVKGSSQRIVR